MYVYVVEVFPEDSVSKHMLDKGFTSLWRAKVAGIHRLCDLAYGKLDDRIEAARWFDSNVGSNLTDDEGTRWLSIRHMEVT